MNPYTALVPLEHAQEWQQLHDLVRSDEFHDKWKWDFHTPSTDDMLQYNTITPEQYEEFQYYWILDALKGLRYGQAFCERFGISNASPLYHFKTQETAERWIKDNYLVKSEAKIH